MTTRSSEAEPNRTSLAVADDSKNNNSTTFLAAKARNLLRKWKRKSSPSSSSSSVNSPYCDDQLLERSLGLNVKRHNLLDDQLLEMSLGLNVKRHNLSDDLLLEMSLRGNKKLWEMHCSGLEEKIMKGFGNDKTGNNLTILSSSHSSCSVNLPFPAESNNDRYGDLDTRALQLQMEFDNQLREQCELKPSPPEVSTCVDGSCAHDACGPAINYAVELMYASATFQMKELVLVVQRRLLNFVDKALVEDVIPIAVVAFHCRLNQLLSHSVQRIARSDLDDFTLEKELPHEVLTDIKSFRQSKQDLEYDASEMNFVYDQRIKRIHKALDSDDVELVKLLLDESDITLDDAFALHYAAAYCNPKVVSEVLNLGIANLNLRNTRGYTVLHVAARRKDPLVIVGLLSKGACVSDFTFNGQTSITICRRLTRPKDYNESTKQGQETNKDRLCIDVLEREIVRSPMAGNMSMSSMMVENDLFMRLLLLENRVALARLLFPLEARLAMEIANAHSTSEFAGLAASKASCRNLREVDLNEIPYELQALQKTVETGWRFFPNCSEVLDRFLENNMQETLLLDNGPPEEQCVKKTRLMELKAEVMKAFDKDKAENNWVSFPSSSACSNSCKASVNHKVRKRQLY